MVKQCLADVSEDEFIRGCYDLMTTTDCFEIYVENDAEKIAKTDYAIGIIIPLVGADGVSGKDIRKKFKDAVF